MPIINFPTSPTTGQTYIFNGTTWTYNGYAWIALGIPGISPPVSGTAVLNFGNESDSAINTITSSLITASNLVAFTAIPTETTETSLDDFKLNGVTFNIENIVDNTSFDIRGNSLNNASGNYTIVYKVTYQ